MLFLSQATFFGKRLSISGLFAQWQFLASFHFLCRYSVSAQSHPSIPYVHSSHLPLILQFLFWKKMWQGLLLKLGIIIYSVLIKQSKNLNTSVFPVVFTEHRKNSLLKCVFKWCFGPTPVVISARDSNTYKNIVISRDWHMASVNQKVSLFSLTIQSYNCLHFRLGKLRRKTEEVLLSFEDTLSSHKAQNLQQLKTCNSFCISLYYLGS